MRNSAKWFLLLHLILGVYASSSVCSKLAAQQPFLSVGFILLYGGMLAALVVYAFGWQQVIKHLPLTTAYANKAITVVWGILLGFLLFGKASPCASLSVQRLLLWASCCLCGPTTKGRAANEPAQLPYVGTLSAQHLFGVGVSGAEKSRLREHKSCWQSTPIGAWSWATACLWAARC